MQCALTNITVASFLSKAICGLLLYSVENFRLNIDSFIANSLKSTKKSRWSACLKVVAFNIIDKIILFNFKNCFQQEDEVNERTRLLSDPVSNHYTGSTK